MSIRAARARDDWLTLPVILVRDGPSRVVSSGRGTRAKRLPRHASSFSPSGVCITYFTFRERPLARSRALWKRRRQGDRQGLLPAAKHKTRKKDSALFPAIGHMALKAKTGHTPLFSSCLYISFYATKGKRRLCKTLDLT